MDATKPTNTIPSVQIASLAVTSSLPSPSGRPPATVAADCAEADKDAAGDGEAAAPSFCSFSFSYGIASNGVYPTASTRSACALSSSTTASSAWRWLGSIGTTTPSGPSTRVQLSTTYCGAPLTAAKYAPCSTAAAPGNGSTGCSRDTEVGLAEGEPRAMVALDAICCCCFISSGDASLEAAAASAPPVCNALRCTVAISLRLLLNGI